ncbi:MAG: PDZ domain-containing protein [Oligoflexales bacterium]|nr:PDZ domain-containing protein [Oligoflexales bacterium]
MLHSINIEISILCIVRKTQNYIAAIFFVAMQSLALSQGASQQIANSKSIQVLNNEKIGIEILGTIAAKEPKEGIALLKSTKDGKVNAVRHDYIVNTQDGSQYLVKEVYGDRVVMFAKGQRYVLYKDGFSAAAKTPEELVQAASPSASRAKLDSYSEPGFERKKNSKGEQEIRLTSGYKEKALGNLSAILMQASAVPFMENGQIIGFQLLEIDPDSIFDKAGIQDGDVITSINGQPLRDAASAIKLLNSLKGESNIEFETFRGGTFSSSKLNVD